MMDSTSVTSDSLDMSCLDIETVKDLKIGIPQEFHCDGMSSEILSAWSRVASLLDDAGAKVEPVSLPHTSLAIPTYWTCSETLEPEASMRWCEAGYWRATISS